MVVVMAMIVMMVMTMTTMIMMAIMVLMVTTTTTMMMMAMAMAMAMAMVMVMVMVMVIVMMMAMTTCMWGYCLWADEFVPYYFVRFACPPLQITFANKLGKFDLEVTTFQMACLFAWNERPQDRISFENLRWAPSAWRLSTIHSSRQLSDVVPTTCRQPLDDLPTTFRQPADVVVDNAGRFFCWRHSVVDSGECTFFNLGVRGLLLQCKKRPCGWCPLSCLTQDKPPDSEMFFHCSFVHSLYCPVVFVTVLEWICHANSCSGLSYRFAQTCDWTSGLRAAENPVGECVGEAEWQEGGGGEGGEGGLRRSRWG